MSPDRIDELLQRALESGEIPADATADERAELAPLLAASAELRLNASRVWAEADASVPTARARFQRRLEEERRAAVPPPRPVAGGQSSGSFFGRFLGSRMLAMSSSVAALAVVAILALVILQPFSSVETASALTVDDYVQVQGVVSATDGTTVTIQSSVVGDLQVALSDQTSVSDESGEREAASLRPGDPVLVSGIVTAKRAIAASNVAVAAQATAPGESSAERITLLKKYREGLVGSIRVLSFSPDGSRARVLLVTPSESLLVDVDGIAMDRFLASTPRPVGAIVRVVAAPDLAKGVFRLEPAESTAVTPPAASTGPQFQNVRGVVVGRTLNVLMVRTDRGTVPVVLRRTTAIRFGESGLTAADVQSGDTVIGYEVLVSGNQEAANSRRVVATLIVVTGKARATTP